MKTIAFDLSFISSEDLVGSAKFIQRLLKEMLKRNLDINYIFYIQKHIPPELFGIDVNRKDIEIILLPKLISRFRRIIFQQTAFYFYQKKCDVLYGYCTYLPLFGKGNKIITLHDMLPFSFTKKHGWFRRKFIIGFTKLISLFVSHIITVSDYSKNDIMHFLNKKKEDISIIYNFIGNDEVVVQGKETQEGKIKTKEGSVLLKKPYICSVSSLQPGKNLNSLIEAFVLFHKKNESYHLYLCGGKGWGYRELFNLVEKLEANEYIHFTGYISDEELDKVYSESEGIAYVSYFEGFGIPPLEGFYHGKPCVASNTTSIPEVVGKAGVLVDPYDIQSITNGLEEMVSRKNEFSTEITKQLSKFNADIETSKFISILVNNCKK